MPFSTGKAQCNLLISAELCSFILGLCNPHETSSTSNAPKILSLSVFECPVALTMGWMAQGMSLPGASSQGAPVPDQFPSNLIHKLH